MRLNQVTLRAGDVDACAEFYRQLGFVLIVDSRPRYVRFECPDGGATFSVERCDEPTTGGRAEIYFECDELDVLVQRLLGRGFRFEHPPVDQRWLWREARLKDPAGNVIVLYSAGRNRRFPPWRVDGLTAPAGDG